LKKLSLTIFTNNIITMLLGIFPHEIGKKRAFFTLGLGIGPPKMQSENHWVQYFTSAILISLIDRKR